MAVSHAGPFEEGPVRIDQLLRLDDLHLSAELEDPAPEGRADLDRHRDGAAVLVHPPHGGVLAELVIDCAQQLVCEAQRDRDRLAAEHGEGLLREGRDLLLRELCRGAGRAVQHRDVLHPVHPVADDPFVLRAPADEIVVVVEEDQGRRVHHVQLLLLPVDALVVLVQVEVVEGRLPLCQQGLFQLVDAVIDGLVRVLPGVEVNDVLLQDLPHVAAAEGRDLFREFGGLFLRDEGRRLEGVDHDLQLRDAEPPVRHPVEPIPPDLLGTDLVAVPDEQRDVRGHALALAGDAPRSQLPADVVGRKRMLRVRLLPQNLPQHQHFHLQSTVVRHRCKPPVRPAARLFLCSASQPQLFFFCIFIIPQSGASVHTGIVQS